MIIKNLTPNQLGSVETLLTTMQDSNPTLTWDNFPMESKPHPLHHEDPRSPGGTTTFDEMDKGLTPVEERLRRIEDKVDTVLTRLDLIFGDHAVVNGMFMSIKDLHKG